MKNIAMTKAEAKETMMEYTAPKAAEAPKYPYGTTLDLNDDTLSKLGLESLPAVGTEVTIMAKAMVTRVSMYEEQGGAESCMALQITDMDITVPEGGKSAAQKLYKDKD